MLNYLAAWKIILTHLVLILVQCVLIRVYFRFIAKDLYFGKVLGLPGFYLLKASVILHERSHEAAVRTFSVLYLAALAMKFPEKLTSHIYAHVVEVKCEPEGEDLGRTVFKGGSITRLIASIMPFTLLVVSMTVYVIWLRCGWQLRIATSFLVLCITAPCLMGSIPSKKDFRIFLKSSKLLILLAITSIVYLWYHPVALTPVNKLLMVAAISLNFVLLMMTLIIIAVIMVCLLTDCKKDLSMLVQLREWLRPVLSRIRK